MSPKSSPWWSNLFSNSVIHLLYLLPFPHSHGPRSLNIVSMFSATGERKGERNGMPTSFKGHTPEVFHITFKDISLARILLPGHYLVPKETGKFVLILKDHIHR